MVSLVNIKTDPRSVFLLLIFSKLKNRNNMIKPQWQTIIDQESNKPYFINLLNEIAKQRDSGLTIFPSQEDTFTAFNYVDLSEVKVVILGQDPYHGTGDNGQAQAHGLAFSVNADIKIPPSLKNIYKELNTDIEGFTIPKHGSLIHWAEQGVLLLNTVLTVQQASAHSHAKLGWETFTDEVIAQLNQFNDGCVFMLWGSHAQKKGKNIDTNTHCVLNSVHPSPLSAYRGFLGCRHFSQANDWLGKNNQKTIDWKII